MPPKRGRTSTRQSASKRTSLDNSIIDLTDIGSFNSTNTSQKKSRPRRSNKKDAPDDVEMFDIQNANNNNSSQSKKNSTNTNASRKKSTKGKTKEKSPNQNKKQTTTRKRAQVVSLDVTYSSSDLDVSDNDDEDEYLPNSPLKPFLQQDPFNNTFSPHQIAQRGLLSDSDSDTPVFKDLPKKTSLRKTKPKYSNDFDSDSDVDLYAVGNLEDRKINLVEDALKLNDSLSKLVSSDDDLYQIDIVNRKKDIKKVIKDVIEDDEAILSGSDFSDLDLSACISPTAIDKVKINNRVKLKKKTQKIFDKVEKSRKLREKEKNSDPGSDIEVISEDGDNKITIRVWWAGKDTIRVLMDKNEKFVWLYQKFAEENNASVADIYLNFEDKKLDPELSPTDLNLSIVDIIEGGVFGARTSPTKIATKSPRKNKDPNIVQLKVQNANRRDKIFISLHKHDKMEILMKKYSEMKKISVDQLRFEFDGEILDKTETPSTLDLDGGECIDVHEKK